MARIKATKSAAFTVSAGAAAGSIQDSLDLLRIAQLQDQWCWAACAQMVLENLGDSSLSQCEIVGKTFGKNCCGGAATSCNIPLTGSQMVASYKKLGVKTRHRTSPAALADIQTEIKSRSPVQSFIYWDAGGGHVMIVYGWITEAQVVELLVRDPWDESISQTTHSGLLTASGRGKWAETLDRFSK